MPVIMFPRILLSLISLAILAGAVYFGWSWYTGYDIVYHDGSVRHFRGESWRFYTSLGLTGWSFLGRFVVLMFIPAGKNEPTEERDTSKLVKAPDGSELHVETMGAADGPTVILTHGWGLNATAWWYTKHALSGRFNLISWDLPGLGRSKPPKGVNLTIDRFAEALGSVVQSTGPQPVLLVGHSIGGMATQTFWRACPQDLRQRVAGMVLIDTTYQNPLQTMWLGPLWRALRKPLIEPMMWLTILLSPLMWLLSWQGYLSGSNQLAMRLTGFGRFATRGQVDFTARLACKGSPGTQAKGNLAMFRWEATEVLPEIEIPVLVLSGTRDIVTLPSASERIVDLVPRARLIRIAGVGHMGLMERSDIYNQAIIAFADEVFAPRTAPI